MSRPRTPNANRGARVPGEPKGRSAAADTPHERHRPGLAFTCGVSHSPLFLFGTETIGSAMKWDLLGPTEGWRAVCIADAGGHIKAFPFLRPGCKKVRVDGGATRSAERTEMESWADCCRRVQELPLSSEIPNTTLLFYMIHYVPVPRSYFHSHILHVYVLCGNLIKSWSNNNIK